MDSLEWSKKYEVLSFSRLTLSSLGFTTDQINSMSDEEIEHLAERLQAQYVTAFYDILRFFVSVSLVEKGWHHAQSSKPLRQDGDA